MALARHLQPGVDVMEDRNVTQATSARSWIPAIEWITAYKKRQLRGDLVAGLTTAVMLIPQAMAYAMLAGLPPIYGLYASTVPLVVYAVFGSSRQLAVGPVAIDSLLLASGVGALALQGSASYIELAILLALMVGAIQLTMGVLRMGFVVNFLSNPVITGFMAAGALIIAASQIKHLLGINLARSTNVFTTLYTTVGSWHAVSWPTIAVAAFSIGTLVALERWKPMIPRALAVVALTTALVWILRLDRYGVAVVGKVPSGLPSFAAPRIAGDQLIALLPTAVTIALVAFMEAISIAKAVARQEGYEIDANREMKALGLANLFGGLFHAYPVTGGLARTAVNAQAGARTPLASLITAATVALALLFFTPLFTFLPKAALAAIIVTAVIGLFDVAEIRHLYRVKRSDLALLGITFAATLTISIQLGIVIGVGASLLWFVIGTTRPHTAVLGRIPGTTAYRNVKNHPTARTIPGVLMVRVDAQFYFGNVDFLKSTLRQLEEDQPEPIHTLIVDASSINQLDSSADRALHDIAGAYKARQIRLIFANVKFPVKEVMDRSGLSECLGPSGLYLTLHDAVTDSNLLPKCAMIDADTQTTAVGEKATDFDGAGEPTAER
ncbi:MAG: solute carrier family 26 protein [Myxococcales bacterium]|nr:solute carrier family 26 protein [Myxococcales bacterium]